MLEVAQNVATLDGFVSLGKSNVTKKSFSLCAMRTVPMRDRNIWREFGEVNRS